MKAVSSKFRDALNGIRELDIVLTYYGPKGYYVLTTEDSDFILTEDEEELITQQGYAVVESDAVKSFHYSFNGGFLKTICKYVELELTEDIPVNSRINVKVGVKVDNSFEYVDLGYFYNKDNSTYEFDTNTYKITAYDRMYELMQTMDYNSAYTFPLSQPKDTFKILIDYFNSNVSTITQKGYAITYNIDDVSIGNENTWLLNQAIKDNAKKTCRDILDDWCEITGCNMYINENEEIIVVPLINDSESQITIDETIMRNTNVQNFTHYGPINYLTIKYGSDVTLFQIDDGTRTEDEPYTEIIISDNIFFLNPDGDINFQLSVLGLWNAIGRFEYDVLEIDTTGILNLDPLDKFNVEYNGTTYSTFLLNNDITFNSGLKETLYTEEPEESTGEFEDTSASQNLKDAFINIDRTNGQVVLKATKSGKLVTATLDADAEDGTTFEVKADNIKLEGYTTINGNFQVDTSGNAKIGNWGILTGSNGGVLYSDNTYNSNVYRTYIQDVNVTDGEDTWAFSTQVSKDKGSSFTGNAIITIGGDAYFKSVTQTSLEENKKDFEKYSGALDEINNVDIYKYHYQNENEDKKKHLGFVIGSDFNYSNVITAEDKNGNEIGADVYSMASLCLQAIKEQQEIIEQLQNEINELKEGK